MFQMLVSGAAAGSGKVWQLQGRGPSPAKGKWLWVEVLPLAEIGPQKRRRGEQENQ